jgi:uncharacterized membrane protein YbaN (DUF454 family)
VLGVASLGLAYLGWILPGLPWTPFVLLASYCFARSSPRLERWLLNNRLFGKFLREYQKEKGIRFRTKLFATAMVVIMVSISVATLISLGKPWYLAGCIPLLALIGLVFLWRMVRTLPDQKSEDLHSKIPGELSNEKLKMTSTATNIGHAR